MRFDLDFQPGMEYPGAMYGNAESNDGLARKLYSRLVIGKEYRLQDFADLLGKQLNAVSRNGVLTNEDSDAQLLLVQLKKRPDAVHDYVDHLYGTTLFWSGRPKKKEAERHANDGTRDSFIFLQEEKNTPFIYYGRAVPLRIQFKPAGTPSHVVFDLTEYAQYLEAQGKTVSTSPDADLILEPEPVYEKKIIIPENTEESRLLSVRTAQSTYRQNVLSLWNNRCAITEVDEKDWLIASHIKPWRESTNEERVDPHNSLLLTPNFDKLFDKGVISFCPDTGRIMLPTSDHPEKIRNLEILHIDEKVSLRKVPDGVGEFLEYHNQYIFGFDQTNDIHNNKPVDDILVKGLA